MNPQLIFCTGMLRSGSTWSFNVIRHLGQICAQKNDLPFESGYFLPERLEQLIARSGGVADGLRVIKSHVLGEGALSLLMRGAASAVCTYRDPRDCVASMMSFTGDSFEQATHRIGGCLRYLDVYSRSGRTLLIRYEEMMLDPLAQIRRIAAHVGMLLDETSLRHIDDLSGIHRSRQICQELQHRSPSTIYRYDGHRVDPASWLHENHIQNGRWGRWQTELTSGQIELLNQQFAPWLTRLEYVPKPARVGA